MEKELVINVTPAEVEIALLEDSKLVEIHFQKMDANFAVGDIFLGKIRKLMPGQMNAAFVDIGHEKDAFLHYTDLGPQLRSLAKYTNGVNTGGINTHLLDNFRMEPDIIKTGKIDNVLAKRLPVLVQLLKEPISTKGPRLSCEITLPGRYLVLTPFTNGVAVSKKIDNAEERQRLQVLIESIKPKNFGVIVRTAAEGKKVADLHEEMALMMDKWEKVFQQLRTARTAGKLLSELDKTSSLLRDLLSDSFHKITVNDKEVYQSIKNYLTSISPDQAKILILHKGNRPIFEATGVNRQIKGAFGKTATLNSGAYLVIEHTEAMHVIDVNSGHKVSTGDSDGAILAVNLEAAAEIARQLRLRDIGGLIVIDFIDMKNTQHRTQLVQAMQDFMEKDRAQHTILPLSKFGLMQITRQRVRPEVTINTAEICPSCHGSGKVTPTVLLSEELERNLGYILQSSTKGAKIKLRVHPYIFAHLRYGFPSRQMRWFMQYRRWIRVAVENSYHLNEYRFFDDNEDEIRIG